MKLVIIESPLAANPGRSVEDHKCYARACMRDSVLRGEAPYASHLLFDQPGLLDDLVVEERMLGIEAGLAWGAKADLTVVYTDCGISKGMNFGIERAKAEGREIEYRELGTWNKRVPSERETGELMSMASTLMIIPKGFRVDPTTKEVSSYNIAISASIGALLARIRELEATK